MKKIVSLLALISLPFFLHSMEEEPSSPYKVSPARKKVTAQFSDQAPLLTQLYDDIDAVPKEGIIAIDNFIISNEKLVTKLIQAANRGVTVSINTSLRMAPKIQKNLEDAGIAVKKIRGLHAKRFIASHEPLSIERETISYCVVKLGSRNFSNIFSHKEMLVSSNDPNDCWKAYRDHINVTVITQPSKAKKSPLKHTPKKKMFVTTRRCDVEDSKAKRVRRLIEGGSESDLLEITSMTFDSKEIVEAIEEVQKARQEKGCAVAIRIFLDGTALKHKDLLDRLIDAGVQIFIFNPDREEKQWGKFPKLQHTKTMIRRFDDKPLTIIATGNLTKRSGEEINIDSYHPDDEELFEAVKAFNDRLAQESVEYKKDETNKE